DRVVQGRQPAVMPHDLRLAEPRQTGRPGAEHVAGQDVRCCRARDLGFGETRGVDRGTAELEAERFAHDSRTVISSSRARGSLTSVHVNVTTSLSSRNQRLTSRPPRIPFRASLRTTARAFGTRYGNSF